jgi:LmbE family N-acetylglucosaminyl deacetylase
VLGVKKENIHFLNIKTQRSDEYVLRDYTEQVEKIGENTDLVIVPSNLDLNIDHVFAYKLALICFRPIKYRTRFVTMEILSSSEWADQPFHPNYYVDISKTFDLKIKALSKYSKQILPFPHPRSPEAVRIKSQQRGLEAGYHYAEAFHIVKWF